jgi:hypothetical protein
MMFKLSRLDYSSDTPISYLKLQQSYMRGLGLSVKKDTGLEGVTLEYMLAGLGAKSPEAGQPDVNFTGGNIKVTPGNLTNKLIGDKLDELEGSIEELAKNALGIVESGWKWLVTLNNQPGIDEKIISQKESPSEKEQTPIFDFYHRGYAYYLRDLERKYQYFRAWVNEISRDRLGSDSLLIERGPP